MLTELLHRAAYNGALSQPLYPDPSVLGRLNADILAAFSHHVLGPAKMVLSAAGAEAAAIKNLAGPLLQGDCRRNVSLGSMAGNGLWSCVGRLRH